MINGKCGHEQFHCDCQVLIIVNPGSPSDPPRYSCQVKVVCTICGEQFRFVGLEPAGRKGFNFGACSSPNGLEARLAIVPAGQPRLPGSLITK